MQNYNDLVQLTVYKTLCFIFEMVNILFVGYNINLQNYKWNPLGLMGNYHSSISRFRSRQYFL